MKSKTWIPLLAIIAILSFGCVPEDLADSDKICMISRANTTIALSITSSNPLPNQLKVSFNDEEKLFADECGGSENAGITFDNDRKKAIVTFNLPRGSELYDAYLNGNDEPIREHFNAQVYSRNTCSDSLNFEQEKLNVFINWEKLDGGCAADTFQAFSQFSFQP